MWSDKVHPYPHIIDRHLRPLLTGECICLHRQADFARKGGRIDAAGERKMGFVNADDGGLSGLTCSSTAPDIRVSASRRERGRDVSSRRRFDSTAAKLFVDLLTLGRVPQRLVAGGGLYEVRNTLSCFVRVQVVVQAKAGPATWRYTGGARGGKKVQDPIESESVRLDPGSEP